LCKRLLVEVNIEETKTIPNENFAQCRAIDLRLLSVYRAIFGTRRL